jgi:serine/threonine protein kinase
MVLQSPVGLVERVLRGWATEAFQTDRPDAVQETGRRLLSVWLSAPRMTVCTLPQVDIFSLGVLLWELATKEFPVRGQLRPVAVPEECPAEVAELIGDCLEVEPRRRPSAEEVFHRIQSLA